MSSFSKLSRTTLRFSTPPAKGGVGGGGDKSLRTLDVVTDRIARVTCEATYLYVESIGPPSLAAFVGSAAADRRASSKGARA